MHDLPLDLLRTFVATVDTGSMAGAARVVGRTPSAISLQMSKLGELVGHPLLRREGRAQVLTRAGELLIPHAREILGASERAIAALADEHLTGPVRFGTVQDLADKVLPRALAGFAQQYPGVTLQVQVAQSALLLEQAMAGELDFAVCFRGGRATRVIRREPMVWLGHREIATLDPLPMAVLDPPCGYIEAAQAALKRAGRRWNVVLRTPSLLGLRGALEAGLAVGCRTALMRSGSIEILGEAERLPPLPEMPFALYVPRPMSPAARRLAALVRGVVQGAAPGAVPELARAS
jgi:DNA-binding transcriptional LysR family regulator